MPSDVGWILSSILIPKPDGTASKCNIFNNENDDICSSVESEICGIAKCKFVNER
jgi:hypothetical protein